MPRCHFSLAYSLASELSVSRVSSRASWRFYQRTNTAEQHRRLTHRLSRCPWAGLASLAFAPGPTCFCGCWVNVVWVTPPGWATSHTCSLLHCKASLAGLLHRNQKLHPPGPAKEARVPRLSWFCFQCWIADCAVITLCFAMRNLPRRVGDFGASWGSAASCLKTALVPGPYRVVWIKGRPLNAEWAV